MEFFFFFLSLSLYKCNTKKKLQVVYLIKHLYLEFFFNFYNLVIKRHIHPNFLNGKNICINTLPKKIKCLERSPKVGDFCGGACWGQGEVCRVRRHRGGRSSSCPMVWECGRLPRADGVCVGFWWLRISWAGVGNTRQWRARPKALFKEQLLIWVRMECWVWGAWGQGA